MESQRSRRPAHAVFCCVVQSAFLVFALTFWQASACGKDLGEGQIAEIRQFVTRHQGTFAGERLQYKVVAADTLLRNPAGEVIGSIFSFSYLKEGVRSASSRPVLFAFNGGPGSSSVWLHMGVIGPRQLYFADDVNPPQVPPFPVIDNPDSVLAVSDVVLIDPVGTGFSRYVSPGHPEDFYGPEEDASSIAQFIQIWLQVHNRWDSPKFLMGESYGTQRAALLSTRLFGGVFLGSMRGVSLNGIILVGGSGGLGQPGPDARFLNSFTAMAATAWYHERIDRGRRTFEQFIAEAELFAAGELHAALARGQDLSLADKKSIAATMAAFVGLPAQLIADRNLRVEPSEFQNALLSDRGLQVGAYDSRYVLPAAGSGGDPVGDDPAMGRYSSAFVGAFHSYIYGALGVRIDTPYRVIDFADVNFKWNRPDNLKPHPGYNPGKLPDLIVAMRRNSQLRLMTIHGYFDLVATVGEAKAGIEGSGVPRERVDERRYMSGHMTYVGPSAAVMSRDVKDFILKAASSAAPSEE
jgi:carboxypeptidase C (cathepsin A)